MRPLSQIAAEITATWKKIHWAAHPYLTAMYAVRTVADSYGADSGEDIVRYFLANARTWRGADARRIKAELKVHLKTDPAVADALTGYDCCDAQSESGYLCTRSPGHTGDHVATGAENDEPYDRWPSKERVEHDPTRGSESPDVDDPELELGRKD